MKEFYVCGRYAVTRVWEKDGEAVRRKREHGFNRHVRDRDAESAGKKVTESIRKKSETQSHFAKMESFEVTELMVFERVI